MASLLKKRNNSEVSQPKFWQKPAYDQVNFEYVVEPNNNGTYLVSLQDKWTKTKMYKDVEFRSPVMAVKYSDLGPDGDKFNHDYVIKMIDNLGDKVGEDHGKKAIEFKKWMKEVCDKMMDIAWNDPQVMKNHKQRALKEAKKQAKKGEDIKEISKKLFYSNAKLALIKENEGDEMLVFKRKHQSEAGSCMRPKIWRKVNPDPKDKEMKEFSSDIPWVSKGSLLRFDFKIQMYDTGSNYGITGKLGFNVIAVYLNNFSRPKQEYESTTPYIEF